MIWPIVSHVAFFPGVLVVLDVCAAGRYAWDGDWGRVGDWAAAAVITFCATMAH
mgnify:CR=1 FL=1